MNNSNLKSLLSTIKNQVGTAKDSKALIDCIKMAKDYGHPLKFDFKIHYFLMFLSFVLFVGMLFLINQQSGSVDNIYIGLTVFFAIGAITPLILILISNSSISDINSSIFNKDSLFDNNLEIIKDDHEVFQYLSDNFKNEFSRGNYSRKFLGGLCKKNDDNNLFLYRFKYTNSRTETYTSTDSKGNTSIRTRTVYDDYYRYGALLDFGYAKSIEIKSYGSRLNPVSYSPASMLFSDTFKLGGVDDISVSKFLKPAVVIAIEDLSKKLDNLNIEIDSNGKICFSCYNSSLVDISSSRKFGIEDPDNFMAEISGETEFNKLESILECFQNLKTHNDKNFTI